MTLSSYRCEAGVIMTVGGHVVSPERAVELRAFFLDDASRLAAKMEAQDEETADRTEWLISYDLRCARELAQAIRAARAFEPEPRVEQPIILEIAA